MIQLQCLNKIYKLNQQDVFALKDINLHINRGEIFGILGKSGAGKSTLLRSINLLEQPTSGKVYIAGIELMALSHSDLKAKRKQIGMIFQHFNLLESRTAYENIALPLELLNKNKAEIQHEVDRLLSLVHLAEHKNHYPNQLSGGQKQRVSIARALATKPDIILCDEPTSALDTNATTSVLNLLKDINQTLGVTIVLITHELNVIKQICDRAAVIDNGELIECGTVVEIFTKPKSSVTKQLIQNTFHVELPLSLKNKLSQTFDSNKSCLVRFTFVGEETNEPFITHLIQQFNIDINIFQANIEIIHDTTIGFTVCQLSGSKENMTKALAHLNTITIKTEILGYV